MIWIDEWSLLNSTPRNGNKWGYKFLSLRLSASIALFDDNFLRLVFRKPYLKVTLAH